MNTFIESHKLDGTRFFVNVSQITCIELDTIGSSISFANGDGRIAKQSRDIILEKIKEVTERPIRVCNHRLSIGPL